jgi:hypothetical protein
VVVRRQELLPAQVNLAALSGLMVLVFCIFCFYVPMEIGLHRLEEREVW